MKLLSGIAEMSTSINTGSGEVDRNQNFITICMEENKNKTYII